MRPFDYTVPAPRLFVGSDSLRSLGREVRRAGASRALVVCGRSLLRQGALLDLVRGALGGACVGTFGEVQAHSPVPSVAAAAEEIRRHGADAVVAVGGGSAIVTARAAAILAAETGDAASLSTSRDASGRLHSPKLLAPKAAVFVVPTTPTTAIPKAGSAVFDPALGRRLALFDPKTRAQAVFVHPDMVASAPTKLALGAALNGLSLGVEGLLATASNPVSDALLMQSLRILSRLLPDRDRHDDPDARMELTVAAILAGQGTDGTGAGLATVLGHAVGAGFHAESGVANLIALPSVLRFNAAAAPAGLARVAEALRCGSGEAVPARLEAICAGLGVPRRLRDIGVPEDALAGIAAAAMGDWFIRSNPRPVNGPDELAALLAEFW